MNPTGRTGNLLIIVFLCVIGVATVIAAVRMPSGQFGEMGPGFFPGLLGGILAVISLVLAVQTFLNRSQKERVELRYRKSWLIVGATILVALILEPLGFIPSIALYVLFNLKLLSELGWFKCILISVVAAVGAYLFFDSLLGIVLPAGDWIVS